jgi:hypothetical protein
MLPFVSLPQWRRGLLIGSGALRNWPEPMSSKSKGKQHKRSKGRRSHTPPLKPTKRRLGQFLGGIATVATLVIGAYAFYPRISVLPDMPLDTANAFSAPFVISNVGRLEIFDVRCICVVNRLVDVSRNILTDIQSSNPSMTARSIKPEEAKTVICPIGIPPRMVREASILIRVSFRPSFWPFKQTDQFRFDALRESNGQVRWTRQPVQRANSN